MTTFKSIEEKAKAYDNAIERAKSLIGDTLINESGQHIAEVIFPELKESEDERMRKGIESIIKHYKDEGEVICPYPFVTIEEALAWLKKQGEQKSADRVESKFEIGDLITNGKLVGKIDEIHEHGYHAYFGDHYADVPDPENWHKWTIQDAKDGDVLLSPSTPEGDKKCPFIFKEIDKGGIVRFYAALLQSEELKIADGITNVMGYANTGYHIPATKEQRDLLFQKMKDAGYKWDADKKELKKMEQPFAWGEDDDKMLSDIINCIKNLPVFYEYLNINGENKITERFVCDAINWLKLIKERIQQKQGENIVMN